jgi:hypothetical protein
LGPSDFHLFGPLKNHLGGKRFAENKEVETEVRKWLRQWSRDFYAAGFDTLVKHWDKCINVMEDMSRNVSSRFEYDTFYVLYPLVTY